MQLDLGQAMNATIVEKNASPSVRRCRACQLQLCKGRGEKPHAALKETARDGNRQVDYLCATCGATMVCSADMSVPGWRQQS